VNGAYGVLIDRARIELDIKIGSSYQRQINFNPNFNPNHNYRNTSYFNTNNQYDVNNKGNNYWRP
jgi:hypothetical protein